MFSRMRFIFSTMTLIATSCSVEGWERLGVAGPVVGGGIIWGLTKVGIESDADGTDSLVALYFSISLAGISETLRT